MAMTKMVIYLHDEPGVLFDLAKFPLQASCFSIHLLRLAALLSP